MSGLNMGMTAGVLRDLLERLLGEEGSGVTPNTPVATVYGLGGPAAGIVYAPETQAALVRPIVGPPPGGFPLPCGEKALGPPMLLLGPLGHDSRRHSWRLESSDLRAERGPW